MNNVTIRRVWDTLIFFCATASALLLPLQIVFDVGGNPFIFSVNLAVSVLFIVDIAVRLPRPVARKDAHASPHEDATPRNSALWIALDIVAALPYGLLPLSQGFHLLRLVKLARVGEFMQNFRQHHIQLTNLLRLIFFLYWLSLSTHWIACGWLALRGVDLETDVATRYTTSLYWSVQTLSTVGFGDITPKTNIQRFYAIIVMFVGVGMYGYIIGNVTSLLSNLNPAKVRHIEQMERLGAFMGYRNLPLYLQDRIRHYYSYLWNQRLGYDESEIVSSLPPSLRTEVALFLKRDIIEKVPLFKGGSEGFIRDIALQMQAVIFMPGDFVVKAGEPGEDMYFISRGRLEVIAPDGKSVYSVLKEGDMFGEIALFLKQPRTATIRAVDYCDLYRLDKEMFDKVLASYPNVAAQIRATAQERLKIGIDAGQMVPNGGTGTSVG